MKTKLFILILFIFAGILNARPQNPPLKLGIVVNIDSSLSHYYFTRSKTETDEVTRYPFNLGNFIFNEISRVFDTLNTKLHTNYLALKITMPEKVHPRLGYFNLMGKPVKKVTKWMSDLYKEDSIRFFLIIDSEFPKPESKDAFLTGQDYGLATYNYITDLVTYYTLIKYLLLDAKTQSKIDFDYETRLAMDTKLFDFNLDEPLSDEERKQLPDYHIKFAEENVSNMALTKIEKILRTIINELNKERSLNKHE